MYTDSECLDVGHNNHKVLRNVSIIEDLRLKLLLYCYWRTCTYLASLINVQQSHFTTIGTYLQLASLIEREREREKLFVDSSLQITRLRIRVQEILIL